jgi:chromosome segregation ATPase
MSEKVVEKPAVDSTPELVAQMPNSENAAQKPVKHDLDAMAKKNRELLDEKKKLQKEYEDLKSNIDKQKQQELEKKEEFKKLYEDEKVKVNELAGLKDKATAYDDYFSKQVEKEIDSLPNSMKEVINNLDKPFDEKLKHIQNIKADMGKTVNSPAIERPGESSVELDISKYEGLEGQKNLISLSHENPKMFDLVMSKLNK